MVERRRRTEEAGTLITLGLVCARASRSVHQPAARGANLRGSAGSPRSPSQPAGDQSLVEQAQLGAPVDLQVGAARSARAGQVASSITHTSPARGSTRRSAAVRCVMCNRWPIRLSAIRCTVCEQLHAADAGTTVSSRSTPSAATDSTIRSCCRTAPGLPRPGSDGSVRGDSARIRAAYAAARACARPDAIDEACRVALGSATSTIR